MKLFRRKLKWSRQKGNYKVIWVTPATHKLIGVLARQSGLKIKDFIEVIAKFYQKYKSKLQ